jgi:hypothetical protein
MFRCSLRALEDDMSRAISVALAFLTLTAASEAASKTPVTVKFVLKAYDGQFDAGETAALQKRAAEQIVGRLRQYAPFFEYTTQSGSAFTLTVTLQPRLVAERKGAPAEVVAHFQLDGPRVKTNPEFVVFRPASDTGGIPGVDGFVKEVDIKVSEQAYRDHLRPLLLRIPIAKTGTVVSNPAGWLLPYGRVELCLDPDSQLDIEHTVRVGEAVLRPKLPAHADGELQGHILGRPVNLTEFQQQLGALSPAQVSVNAIWVSDYRDLIPCSADFQK